MNIFTQLQGPEVLESMHLQGWFLPEVSRGGPSALPLLASVGRLLALAPGPFLPPGGQLSIIQSPPHLGFCLYIPSLSFGTHPLSSDPPVSL